MAVVAVSEIRTSSKWNTSYKFTKSATCTCIYMKELSYMLYVHVHVHLYIRELNVDKIHVCTHNSDVGIKEQHALTSTHS